MHMLEKRKTDVFRNKKALQPKCYLRKQLLN